MAELSTILQENLTGVRVVRAFASEEHEEAKFDVENSGVAGEMIKAARLQAMNVGIMTTAFLTAMGLILWFGGAQVIDGRLSHGELAQFLFYLQILGNACDAQRHDRQQLCTGHLRRRASVWR